MREVKQDPFSTFLHHLLTSSSTSPLTKGILADTRLSHSCAPLLLKPCTSQAIQSMPCQQGAVQEAPVHCLAKLWPQPLCQLPLLQMS